MDFTSTLKDDYENICKKILLEIGYTILPSDDAEEIELKCINYLYRLPQIKPRKVIEPKGFICPEELAPYYSELKQKIDNGDDLKPYLSKRILQNYKDKMLEDWNVYHLHFFPQIPHCPPNVLDRKLLYCCIKDDNVYVLFIGDHTQFCDTYMLQIMRDNWPELMTLGATGHTGELLFTPTQEDIKEFRNHNINVIHEIDGQIFAPIGGGYDSCGNSTIVTITNDRNLEFITDFEDKLPSYEDKIKEAILSQGVRLPDRYSFSLVNENEMLFLKENNSNLIICDLPISLNPQN